MTVNSKINGNEHSQVFLKTENFHHEGKIQTNTLGISSQNIQSKEVTEILAHPDERYGALHISFETFDEMEINEAIDSSFKDVTVMAPEITNNADQEVEKLTFVSKSHDVNNNGNIHANEIQISAAENFNNNGKDIPLAIKNAKMRAINPIMC